MRKLDAVVVGSGPNGLTAAIVLARMGLEVQVFEAEESIGGGARTAESSLPGFKHDLFSAIHPMAYCSPIFRTFPLEQHGLKWIHSPAALAHPLDDGSAVLLQESIEETIRQFPADAETYRDIFSPARDTLEAVLTQDPQLLLIHVMRSMKLGVEALTSASAFLRNFRTEQARALIAGLAGHSMLPLHKATTTGIAMALATTAHVGGWPFPEGGAQKISDALASYFRSLGGNITTGVRVRNLRELPEAHALLLDVSPLALLEIAGQQFPRMFAKVLRHYEYGMAAFKVDWALSQPVPWKLREVAKAATIHMGGLTEEIEHSERQAWCGRVSEKPFIIAAQHSLFDPTRAPQGKHTLWAYCHVPNGSETDMLRRMEDQIERFAPGFRDCVIARNVMPPTRLEALNANLVGGDIACGQPDIWQMFSRPSVRLWSTPLEHVFICSAATPPGAGVHGMCGYFAAMVALKKRFGITFTQRPADAFRD